MPFNRRLLPTFFAGLMVLLGCFFMPSSPALSKENPKYAAFVMDSDTGAILYQKNADARRHPASLTKVMTLILLFDALEQGRLNLDDRIPISRRASAMAPSKIGLPSGSSIKVKDAIYAIVTKSANDISVAVAEHLGRTEGNFARRMTARAREVGMNNTIFKNASGLHDPGQVTTARDMAKMARFVINNYPGYYRYFSTKNFSFRGKSYHNHNRLMSTYKGMDGLKTGFINASGFNLIASAVRGNTRLIGVVFGGKSATSRNTHMTQLLDKAFGDMKSRGRDVRIAEADMSDRSLPSKNKTENAPVEKAAIPVPQPKPQIALAAAKPTNIKQTEMISSLVLLKNAPKPERDAAGFSGLLTEADKMASPVFNELSALQLAQDAPLREAANQKQAKSRDIGALAVAENATGYKAFDELTGQGDFDDDVSERLETGMLAIAAIKSSSIKPGNAKQGKQAIAQKQAKPVLTLASADVAGSTMKKSAPAHSGWSIQVGAFSSRASTDQALHAARKKLPSSFSAANAVIAPLKSRNGWVFRARLAGLTKAEAQSACRLLPTCLAIAPGRQ